MTRRAALIVVATVLMGLLFASVSTSGGVGLWREPQWDPSPRDSVSSGQDASPVPADDPVAVDVDDDDDGSNELPGWIDTVMRAVLVAMSIVGAWALATAVWRHRPRVRWRRRSAGGGDFDALPDVAAAVVEEAARQRDTLLSGEPRNAIVRCWLQLEGDVESAGLARHPADTSAEFTERVLGLYTVDPEAIRTLGTLYREARFSHHVIDEASRRSALDALERLHQGLADSIAGRVGSIDAAERVAGAPT